MTRPRPTHTHTVAELEVSETAYREIEAKLRAADYGHCFMEGGMIDLTGIGITIEAIDPCSRSFVGREFEVGLDGVRAVDGKRTCLGRPQLYDAGTMFAPGPDGMEVMCTCSDVECRLQTDWTIAPGQRCRIAQEYDPAAPLKVDWDAAFPDRSRFQFLEPGEQHRPRRGDPDGQGYDRGDLGPGRPRAGSDRFVKGVAIVGLVVSGVIAVAALWLEPSQVAYEVSRFFRLN